MSLHDAAEALGVHYMTAYRYVRLGQLDAAKVGGVWQVTRGALDEFRAVGAPAPTGRRRAPWSARLEARLLAGDAHGSWNVVEAALLAGTEIDELYLEVIAPAMTSIGERWERGEVDIAVEHRAAGLVMRILGRLGPRFARRGRRRGSVVLGTPAGEQHSLPLALVADVLRGAGWDVSDLGADVPPDSFTRVVQAMAPVTAIGVSVSTADFLPAAAATVAALRAGLGTGAPILLGGRAVEGTDHAVSLGADGWAPDARAFVDLLDRIAAGTWPDTGTAAAV